MTRCGYLLCRSVPVRRFLCLFWREIHTKGLRARFPMRPEEDEGRKVPESTEVDRREQAKEVGGSRLLGCVDPETGLANMRK